MDIKELDEPIVGNLNFDDKFERVLDKMGGFGRYQIVVYVVFTLTFMVYTTNNNMLVFGSIKPVYSCYDNLTINQSQMVGFGLGSFFAGKLADSYGRKKVYLAAFIPQIIFGLAASRSVNWQMYCAIAFLLGVCLGAWATVSFTHLIENLGPKHRIRINPLGGGTISDLWLAGIAYATSDWRTLMLCTNSAAVLAIPVLLFAVVESPRWLLHKGRTKEAKQVMERISRWNGHPEVIQYGLWQDLIETSENIENKVGETQLGYLHLIRNRHLRNITLTLGFCWFSFNVVIYGLYFNVWTLPGSPYVIYVCMTVLSWAAQTVALIAETKFVQVGRRALLLVGCVGVLVCSMTITVYLLTNNLTDIDVIRFSNDWFITGLAVCATAFTMILFMTSWTLSSELYPISIRNTAQGLLAACSRFGAILSPHILLEPSHHWMPILYINIAVFITIAMIAVYIFLPETKNLSLPSKMSSVSLSKKVCTAVTFEDLNPR